MTLSQLLHPHQSSLQLNFSISNQNDSYQVMPRSRAKTRSVKFIGKKKKTQKLKKLKTKTKPCLLNR